MMSKQIGIDLISDALRFGGLWYAGPNAISDAAGECEVYSRIELFR
jgi:hypothetical protein